MSKLAQGQNKSIQQILESMFTVMHTSREGKKNKDFWLLSIPYLYAFVFCQWLMSKFSFQKNSNKWYAEQIK